MCRALASWAGSLRRRGGEAGSVVVVVVEGRWRWRWWWWCWDGVLIVGDGTGVQELL